MIRVLQLVADDLHVTLPELVAAAVWALIFAPFLFGLVLGLLIAGGPV